MLICREKFNPLQRRFLTLFAGTLLFTAGLMAIRGTFMVGNQDATISHARSFSDYLLAIMPVIPFLGMMFLIPRYLLREKDEFVRTLVLRSLLWAFAIPMVIDTIWAFLWPLHEIVAMLNIDIFCVTAMVAFRVQGWRYR